MALQFRFYNGYDKISESIPYSKQGNQREGNINGLFLLKAEPKSFFEAPGIITYDRSGSTVTNFDLTICSKFSTLGVILVDPDREAMSFPYYMAKTDKEAKKLGDEVNEAYMLNCAQKHIEMVEETKAAGRTPLPAMGYTKYALKLLGIADPALTVRNFVEKSSENEKIVAMQAQIDALMKQVQPRA